MLPLLIQLCTIPSEYPAMPQESEQLSRSSFSLFSSENLYCSRITSGSITVKLREVSALVRFTPAEFSHFSKMPELYPEMPPAAFLP